MKDGLLAHSPISAQRAHCCAFATSVQPGDGGKSTASSAVEADLVNSVRASVCNGKSKVESKVEPPLAAGLKRPRGGDALRPQPPAGGDHTMH